MATPGLTPVIGATSLRVTDGQTRDEGRTPRQKPGAPRERRHASDEQGSEARDSYSHGDTDRGPADDRAEHVRRLLERAMAKAERALQESGSLGSTASPAGVTTNAPRPAPGAAELAARYQADAPDETPRHVIDTRG